MSFVYPVLWQAGKTSAPPAGEGGRKSPAAGKVTALTFALTRKCTREFTFSLHKPLSLPNLRSKWRQRTSSKFRKNGNLHYRAKYSSEPITGNLFHTMPFSRTPEGRIPRYARLMKEISIIIAKPKNIGSVKLVRLQKCCGNLCEPRMMSLPWMQDKH